MICGLQLGREEFGWNDEGGGVGVKVGEEECQSIEYEECDMVVVVVFVIIIRVFFEVVVYESEYEYKESYEEEVFQLDDLVVDYVDCCYGELVIRNS